MKVFVTGVAGQLGHDVMNELAKRGYEGIGTDIAPEYSGVADGTAVVSMPYVQLDITDADAVDKIICELKPDVVVHCAAWTAVDLRTRIREKRFMQSMLAVLQTLQMPAKRLAARWFTSAPTMYLMDKEPLLGHRTARTTSHLTSMASLSLTVSLLFLAHLTITLSCVSHGYLERMARTSSRQC